MTRKEAYAHFGGKTNARWSWAAQNAETGRVIISLWKDLLTEENGVVKYSRTYPKLDHRFIELTNLVLHALCNNGGVVDAIVIVNKEDAEEPREMKDASPHPYQMRITDFDCRTLTLKAEQVSPSVQ